VFEPEGMEYRLESDDRLDVEVVPFPFKPGVDVGHSADAVTVWGWSTRGWNSRGEEIQLMGSVRGAPRFPWRAIPSRFRH
jgi:hypothetical protein